MPSVFFFISAHGLGHAAREIEIINALAEVDPGLAIVVRTAAPRWLLDATARPPITLLPGECDTGVVQVDSLRLDARTTIDRAAAFHRTLDRRTGEEAAVLHRFDARLVVGDVPPLACAAAAAAGIPSVVISNFTWDWIYEGYGEYLTGTPDLVPALRHAYSLASAGWRLPLHGGFTSVRPVLDLPFVARHASHGRAEVRRRLRLPADRPLVLFSFGGYGLHGLDFGRLDCLDEYGVVLVPHDHEEPSALPAGVERVATSGLYAAGLRYEDLVAAVDVVVSKPGYGIISECLANGPALLYTSRGRFAEYDVLTAAMPRFLRSAFIDQDALFAGRWRKRLDALLALPAPPEHPRTDGARVIAGMIRDLVNDRRSGDQEK
ncbi:MAG TPA: hypothetical protein VLD67_06875 [Vicinamibacterales bacterium]|nr:hypothetical protein [Vicinamibacterales bacterium]